MFVGGQAIRKFYNRTLLKMHIAAFSGFMIGVKLCDYLLYDEQPFNELRENMEDEFWAHYGEPSEIQPYVVPSVKEGNPMRKSWIYIMFEKDRLIKKKEDID